MQTIIRGGMAALALVLTSAAHAQDKPKDPAHEHGAEEKGRTAEHVERAGSELKEAGKAASTEARAAVKEARKDAHESMREAREKTRSALEEARKQASESAEGARVAMKEAGEQARTAMEAARQKTRTWLEEAREQTRLALVTAAEGLESKVGKEEREKSRAQRGDTARAEQWSKLRAHMPHSAREHAADHSAVISPEMKAELGTHADRTARLARIRALAVQAKDTKTVERCDALLAKELERHGRHVNELFEKSEATARPEGKSEHAHTHPHSEEKQP